MHRRPALVALILLGTLACLEPPVSESLEVRMLSGGRSIVSVAVALRDPADYDKAPKVQERLDAEARALTAGSDAWSARLRAAEPARERTRIDREGGTLRRVVRHAAFDDPDDLGAFLRDAGVSVAYAEGDGWAELSLVPAASSRATSAQRQTVRAALDRFAKATAAYLSASEELYAYLDRRPERARACLGGVVSSLPEGESLEDDEASLVDTVGQAIGELGKVLEPAPGEAWTVDELSGLVYDPFVAPVTVAVSGRVLEKEGFPGGTDEALVIPRRTLWSAFTRLSGRWISPDTALALWRHDLSGDERPIDLEPLVAARRRVSAPGGADEIRGAIERELVAAPVYRVRWEPAETDAVRSPFDLP